MAEQPAQEHHPDVRFSLANERTLLAYQRTAIGLMGAAIAVAHFFGDTALVLVFAGALLLTAVIAGVGGYLHFRKVDRAIRTGTAIGPGPAAHALSLALLACLAVAAVYVVTRG